MHNPFKYLTTKQNYLPTSTTITPTIHVCSEQTVRVANSKMTFKEAWGLIWKRRSSYMDEISQTPIYVYVLTKGAGLQWYHPCTKPNHKLNKDKAATFLIYNFHIKFTFVPDVLYSRTQKNVFGIDEDLFSPLTDKRHYKPVIYIQEAVVNIGLV